MRDVAQAAADEMHDAVMNLRLGKHSVDGVGKPGEAVHQGDEDILNAAALELRHHPQPEASPFGLLDPEAQDLFVAAPIDAEGHIHRLVLDQPLIPNLHAQTVEEHHRINGIERTLLPLGDFLDDGVGDVLMTLGAISIWYSSSRCPWISRTVIPRA